MVRMDASHKRQAAARLRRAAGQIRGLERMVLADKYCVNIIHQSLAIKKALSSFEDFILQNHLVTYVVSQIKSGRKTKAAEEIMSIYKLSKIK